MRSFLLMLFLGLMVGAGVVGYQILTKPQGIAVRPSLRVPSPTKVPGSPDHKNTSKQTLFVPYWQMTASTIDFPQISYASKAEKRLVYFGVSVDRNGIIKNEQGYQNLSLFSEKSPSGVKKYLGVRMTDQDRNLSILEDTTSQEKIISDVITTAKDRTFDGIVVDLELPPSLKSSLPAQINTFLGNFSKAANEQGEKFAITMYGDAFYRKRPYDIAYLGAHIDEMMIMAYDLHKAGGEPGPNFPLAGKETFGYDISTMVADFGVVPAEKLTVIYGMYGYDWVVDERKRPIKGAKSVTLAEVKKNYLGQCASLNCVTTRDKMAKETEIDFIDKQLLYHVIWFEDVSSSEEKTKLLNDHGISSVAFWAYGYF